MRWRRASIPVTAELGGDLLELGIAGLSPAVRPSPPRVILRSGRARPALSCGPAFTGSSSASPS